jgi:hypothetical protein
MSSFASAECGALTCVDVYIEELYPEAIGGAWVKTSGNEQLVNCTADAGIYLRLDGTLAGYKEVYATLLAAQLSEKKVNLRIAEGSNPCKVWYVTLNRNNW